MGVEGMTITERSRKQVESISNEEAVGKTSSCSLEVSENVVDPDILKIVAFTVKESRTVKEISEAMGIPLVKTYSLIDWMEENGLLVEVGKVRTALHGHATRYISTVKSGSIELQNNRLIIKCVHKDGSTKVCDTYLISNGAKE